MNRIVFDYKLNKYGTSDVIMEIIKIAQKCYLRVGDWCFRLRAYDKNGDMCSDFNLTNIWVEQIGFDKPIHTWNSRSTVHHMHENVDCLYLYMSDIEDKEKIISFSMATILCKNVNVKCLNDATIESLETNGIRYTSRGIEVDKEFGILTYEYTTLAYGVKTDSVNGIHINEVAKKAVFDRSFYD